MFRPGAEGDTHVCLPINQSGSAGAIVQILAAREDGDLASLLVPFVNVYLRKRAPRGQLPKLDIEDENATFGLKTLQDLGWKDLLDGFTCTECGRCQDACPAHATGKPLNPKAFIMGIREMSVEAEHGLDHPELADRSRNVRFPDDRRFATAMRSGCRRASSRTRRSGTA
jgi:ferredoxin